jgi:hypothetical protein
LRGDAIQWQFSEDKLHFLLSIVFYCNTSVGYCRFSLLLASGGSCSWLTCSFQCPVRFGRYLFAILLISSSTNVILESSWSVLLLTYRGALNTILIIFDCTLCMIFVFDVLAQRQSCIPLSIKYTFLVGKYKITGTRLAVKPVIFSPRTLSNKSLPPSLLQISRPEFNCEVYTEFYFSMLAVTGNTSGQNRTRKPLVAVEDRLLN